MLAVRDHSVLRETEKAIGRLLVRVQQAHRRKAVAGRKTGQPLGRGKFLGGTYRRTVISLFETLAF